MADLMNHYQDLLISEYKNILKRYLNTSKIMSL